MCERKRKPDARRGYLYEQTASMKLTFAIYMLTEHPTYAVRCLREEVLNKVGNAQSTFEQMKDMKY